MTKIICANASCKYNNDKNVCTAKKISMSWQSVMTLHEGQQEYLKCKQYEMDDEYKRIYKSIREMMEKST